MRSKTLICGLLTINFGRLELSRWNEAVKEQVNLAECAVFRLRHPEPAPNVAQEVGARVEQTGFGSPIPG